MKAVRAWGFTLIELLVVIAIIAILAAFTAVVLPRALERAKIARCETDFNAIRQAFTNYATANSSFPPGYGFRRWYDPGTSLAALEPKEFFWLEAWVDFPDIKLRGTFNLYDEFSPTYDTNENGEIEHLEYLLVDPAGDEDLYDGPPFMPAAALDGLDNAKARDFARPYVYIPVNKAQFKRVKKYYEDETRRDYWGETWDPTDLNLQSLRFPPPKYDAYVLISMGPRENTCGIVCPPLPVLENIRGALGASAEEDLYHVLALRAYYLATRDLNDNGLPDYDFRARSRQNEAADNAFSVPGVSRLNWTPDKHLDPRVPNLYGPIIFHGDG